MSTTTNTTAATIESTIEGALRTAGLSTYQRQAKPVIDALVAREQDLAEKILDYAEEQGANTDEVTSLLTSLGVALKPEEPETVAAEANGQGDTGALARIEASLSSLTATVSSLSDFARRNGYRG
jgi:hypothetical protein